MNGGLEYHSSPSGVANFSTSNVIGTGRWGSWNGGHIQEFLFFDEVLSDEQRYLVNNNLSQKLGLDDSLVDSDGDGDFDDTDCADFDPSIHSSAQEICDGIDNDCNADTADGLDDMTKDVASKMADDRIDED